MAKTLQLKDPEGTSYTVFHPRRLAAEELRDAMLHVSGELNPVIGGIPVRPEMNLEAALQPRQVMGTFAEAWQPSRLPKERHRRSLYALKLRGLRDPFLEVFNAPPPDLSCEARETSTVTPQVFAMFNSEVTFDRALAAAKRVKEETSSHGAAIRRLFALAFGRRPNGDELELCLTHWHKMTARHELLSFAPPHYPRQVVRVAVEENTGEPFTFVEPLEVPGILDLSHEHERTRAMYGVGREPTDAFGRKCLLARRLVEQGVRFIQLYAGTWDSHDYIARAHGNLVRRVDQPIAALLTDLKRRGLLEDTLVVWCGEFGRSPDNGIRGGTTYGRDHNPHAMTIWFAGGGVKAGHTIGATDETGAEAVECVHHVRDLHVTILRLLGLDDNKLTYFHGGRFKQLSQFGGEVIHEIIA